MDAEERARYSRHLVLEGFGAEGQRRLKGSSALIVGLGGLGVPISVQLASSGIGRLGIVDPDLVELSNLQRQFIFSEADVGRKKVVAAKEKLHRVNPNVEVDGFDSRLVSDNALRIAANYDLVVDATDTLQSRYLINDTCVLLGKPDVYASVLGFEGVVSVFDARKGPCYRCLYPRPPPPGSVRSCEEAGVSSVVAGVVGALQANQALSILLGTGSPLIGRMLVFDGQGNSFEQVNIKKDQSCMACGPDRSLTGLIDYDAFCAAKERPVVVAKITPEELKTSLDSGQRIQLVDVREPAEYEICHIEGSILIPLGQLGARLGELKKTEPVVVYCHHGVRSASAVAFMQQTNFSDVRNLEGGIEAWAARVDRRMAKY